MSATPPSASTLVLHGGSAFPEDFIPHSMNMTPAYDTTPGEQYKIKEINQSKSDINKDYWASKVEPFENKVISEKVEEKKTPAWKKAGLLFLLAPKGSLIFAPVLFKKLMGSTSFSLSGPALKILAAKVALSFLLWSVYRMKMARN